MTLILLHFQIMIFSKKIILVLILLAWECLLSQLHLHHGKYEKKEQRIQRTKKERKNN